MYRIRPLAFCIGKKCLAAFAMLLFSATASGQSARDAWLHMPDCLSSFLDAAKRAEMLSSYEMQSEENVENPLHGTSRLDTLTRSYLKATLSGSSHIELKLLPTNGEDSLICMVNTFDGPLAESRVRLFTADWQALSDTCYTSKTLLQKPDTMTAEVFAGMLESLSLVLWRAALAADSDTLQLTPSFPLQFVEDKERFKALVVQRNLNWDGSCFK